MLTPRTVLGMALALALGVCASDANEVKQIKHCGSIDAPGSYLLAKDLAASGDCLVVTSDFVTIDLGGFPITGAGPKWTFKIQER